MFTEKSNATLEEKLFTSRQCFTSTPHCTIIWEAVLYIHVYVYMCMCVYICTHFHIHGTENNIKLLGYRNTAGLSHNSFSFISIAELCDLVHPKNTKKPLSSDWGGAGQLVLSKVCEEINLFHTIQDSSFSKDSCKDDQRWQIWKQKGTVFKILLHVGNSLQFTFSWHIQICSKSWWITYTISQRQK